MGSTPWTEATERDIGILLEGPGRQDVKEALRLMSLSPAGRVVEIGCGVGRLAELFQEYVGYDVSPAFVQAARLRGVTADLLPVPEWERGDWLLIAYVFCHIPRAERLAYLELDIAPRLFISILPGDGSVIGWPLIYTIPPEEFEQDLGDTGWSIVKGPHRTTLADPNHDHLFYFCER